MSFSKTGTRQGLGRAGVRQGVRQGSTLRRNFNFWSKDQLTKKKDRILIKDLISNIWKFKRKEARLILQSEIIGRDPFNQNSNRTDREKWSTSKSGPAFSKLFRLDRTDPLSFGPKFPEILVDWSRPVYFLPLFRKAWLSIFRVLHIMKRFAKTLQFEIKNSVQCTLSYSEGCNLVPRVRAGHWEGRVRLGPTWRLRVSHCSSFSIQHVEERWAL